MVGIRDIGGDLCGQAEVIAVEVKAGHQPFNTATGQAYGYSVYAERCYLADKRASRPAFTLDELDMASKLGVGLLAIGSDGGVQEVLTAPLHQPLMNMRGDLIEKLGYSECTICGALFRRGDMSNFRRHVRTGVGGLGRAYDTDRGLMYWLDSVAERKKAARTGYVTARRYICPDCVYNLFGEVLEAEA